MSPSPTNAALTAWPLLATAIRGLGEPDFYERLGAAFAGAVAVERWLVIRFSQSQAPKILCNHGGMSEDAIAFYFRGLYRLDPLHRLAGEPDPPEIVTISRLRADDIDNQYYDEIYRTAFIRDEIALILRLKPGAFITLNLDTAETEFSDAVIERAQGVAAPFVALHETHQAMVGQSGGGQDVETANASPRLPAYDALIAEPAARHSMTDRERDIAHRALRGFPNALIARDLGITAGTVRNHRARLYAKLDITSERELFALCLDLLLEDEEASDAGRAASDFTP